MSKRKILLIEPDSDLASMVERFLGKADFEVAIAHDSLLGLKLAADLKPHLALIDISLDSRPEGGVLVGKSFRQDDLLKKIPLVLMAPENLDEDNPALLETLHMIFDGFLYKPFADTELKRVVENYTGFGEKDRSSLERLDNLLSANSGVNEDADLRNLVKDLKERQTRDISQSAAEIIERLEMEIEERNRLIKERDKRIEGLLERLSDMEFDHSSAMESMEKEKATLEKRVAELSEQLEFLQWRLKQSGDLLEKAMIILKTDHK